jgi:hypothetical protein
VNKGAVCSLFEADTAVPVADFLDSVSDFSPASFDKQKAPWVPFALVRSLFSPGPAAHAGLLLN